MQASLIECLTLATMDLLLAFPQLAFWTESNALDTGIAVDSASQSNR